MISVNERVLEGNIAYEANLGVTNDTMLREPCIDDWDMFLRPVLVEVSFSHTRLPLDEHGQFEHSLLSHIDCWGGCGEFDDGFG